MRIALNASTKIVPRLMSTFWAALDAGIPMAEAEVVLMPVAGFLRATTGTDDNGASYELADDPAKEMLIACGEVAMGGMKAKEAFAPLLSDPLVMGKDLNEYPEVLDKFAALTDEMFSGTGAVKALLG